MSEKKLVITEYKDHILAFLMNGLKAEQLIIDKTDTINVGDIYVGKVRTVKKDIGAAFVEIKDSVTGFLPFDEIIPSGFLNRSFDGRILEGDEICVMVSKEAVKTKLCALTMKLSLTGRYAVAIADSDKIHASAKLNYGYSSELINKLDSQMNNRKYGLIIRTNASSALFEDVLEEAESLDEQLADLISISDKRTVFSCLYKSKPGFISRINDLRQESFDEIVTDSKEVFALLCQYFTNVFNLRLYNNDSLSLKALYCLERAINDATSRNVFLNCGGYLVIEPTEALTVIDVNSGKSEGKKDIDVSNHKINSEAAIEIARQLKLRNIFGIIIVDFINYSDKSYEQELISLMRKEIRDDYAMVKVCGFSSLGLMEITRSKKYASVYDYKFLTSLK